MLAILLWEPFSVGLPVPWADFAIALAAPVSNAPHLRRPV